MVTRSECARSRSTGTGRVARQPSCARIRPWPSASRRRARARRGRRPSTSARPAQVFGAARERRRRTAVPGRHLHAGRRPGPQHGRASPVHPDHGLDAAETADTVIVPGIHGGSPLTDGTVDAGGRRPRCGPRRARGARVMSICTGAFVLAAAGLLDGRPATTHWAYADRFRRLFPRSKLDPDVLFVDDGDVLTSAGVGRRHRPVPARVRRDHGSRGRQPARPGAAWCRPGATAARPSSSSARCRSPASATTAATRAWALDRLRRAADPGATGRARPHERAHVHPPLPRGDRAEPGALAAASSASSTPGGCWRPPTCRRPGRRAAGFGTAGSLRQHLQAAIGVSPTTYRRTFRPPTGDRVPG